MGVSFRHTFGVAATSAFALWATGAGAQTFTPQQNVTLNGLPGVAAPATAAMPAMGAGMGQAGLGVAVPNRALAAAGARFAPAPSVAGGDLVGVTTSLGALNVAAPAMVSMSAGADMVPMSGGACTTGGGMTAQGGGLPDFNCPWIISVPPPTTTPPTPTPPVAPPGTTTTTTAGVCVLPSGSTNASTGSSSVSTGATDPCGGPLTPPPGSPPPGPGGNFEENIRRVTENSFSNVFTNLITGAFRSNTGFYNGCNGWNCPNGGWGGSNQAIYYGGGGSVVQQGVDGNIGSIDVEGGREVVTEYAMETFSEVVPIRAICIDDRGSPHPASRTDQAPAIAQGWAGEVFRCMAGSRMEITIGKMVNNEAVFDGGRTMSCAKGQALAYDPNGQIQCVAQRPEGECFERSLLRRYGPGIKYATLTTQRQVERQRVVERGAVRTSQTASATFQADGGVGGVGAYQ